MLGKHVKSQTYINEVNMELRKTGYVVIYIFSLTCLIWSRKCGDE